MLSSYDKIVIGFYLAFMVGMGLVFRRFIRNTSDYFRSGGEMLGFIQAILANERVPPQEESPGRLSLPHGHDRVARAGEHGPRGTRRG